MSRKLVALNQSSGVLLVCLGYNSMCLGVPFIAPRAKGVVCSVFVRTWLPYVRGCTGLSGAHRTVNSARFISIPTTPTVELAIASFVFPAHRTVRCCHVSTVDYALIIDAGESRWPPGSPDSLVHTGQSSEL
jgi:hypothetical protein